MKEKFLATVRITRDVTIVVTAASMSAARRQIETYGITEAANDYCAVDETVKERFVSCARKDQAP